MRTSLILAALLITSALKLSAQNVQNDQSTFEFIENKGQWDQSVRFRGELSYAEFYLQKNGFLVALHNPSDVDAAKGHTGISNIPDRSSQQISYKKDLSGVVTSKSISNAGAGHTVHSHAYSMEFVGADTNAQVSPDKTQPYYNNYIIGNDPSKWASKVKIYGAVTYKNIYPNIDVRYYSEYGQLKYDLIINPGGDPSKIVMKYTGVDKLQIKNGELIVKTSVGDVRELSPYSYQVDNTKGKTDVDCKYQLSGNTVRLQMGKYSKTTPLIIDPSLIFASFTGSKVDQWGFTATPAPDGSLFSGGIVFGQGFPVTTGAYQSNFGGGGDSKFAIDIGIMKFSPNGSSRLYATYLGGSGNDYPHSLISDAQGNLIVMGRTTSGSGPNGYPGSVVGSDKGGSIVVSKLNFDGSKLIGSLLIGGTGVDGLNIKDLETQGQGASSLIRNYGDDSRSEVNIDGAGNIYVAAQTRSTDFPIYDGFQAKLNNGSNNSAQDGVIMKINPNCTGVIWSTYLGGSGDDGAFSIDINPVTGNIYVAGGTTTPSGFPGVNTGTPKFNTYQGGDADGFVSIISNDGKTLLGSTYLGTGDVDIIYGIKFDKLGFPYVMGVSRGGHWPVKRVVTDFYSNPNSCQFVSKLKPDLSDFVYSTVFGSGSTKPNMSPVAFLVDRCENVYISGWGGWISKSNTDPYDQAGVAGMPVTPDAIKKATDNQDFYFIVIQKNASKLLYGTFFGQDGGEFGEHVDGGTSRYDKQGVIYQAICANCYGGARFPTTPGVVGPVNGSSACNLAAVKISFNFAGVASGPESFVDGIHDSIGCAPFEVTLRDTIGLAKNYIWQFDDGTPDLATTQREIKHTYTSVGTYKVALIAIDSNSCNVADTAYTYIKVGDVRANVNVAFQKIGPCTSNEYSFQNLSTTTNPAVTFGDSSFVWTFGDSSDPVITGTGSLTHAYPGPGVYPVTVTMVDTNFCNVPYVIDTFIRVNPLVVAQFVTPAGGCAPYDAVFNNTSLAGQTFHWDFGDGTSSDETNPVHNYPAPGEYTIKLEAVDLSTCNQRSDTSMTIKVAAKPIAGFSYIPVTPVQNRPNIFTNLSTGGVRFNWLFGDGEGLIKNSADTVLHQYNSSGTFHPCLVAINEFNCSDTVCQDLVTEILPLIDVPNAFTPTRPGKNASIAVQGYGISNMICHGKYITGSDRRFLKRTTGTAPGTDGSTGYCNPWMYIPIPWM